MKIIINADDFGANDGINKAVESACQDGCLNSASILVYGIRTQNAVQIAKNNPKLKIGLHAEFNSGFVKIMLASIFFPNKTKTKIESELRKQIAECKNLGITKLSHLDSHRHIHMLPEIFQIFKRIAAEYKIPRVRVTNERSLSVKGLVLTVLRFLSRAHSNIYFVSFGNTKNKIIVPRKYNAAEIAFHPMAFTNTNGAKNFGERRFYFSPRRLYEYKIIMNPDFPKNTLIF